MTQTCSPSAPRSPTCPVTPSRPFSPIDPGWPIGPGSPITPCLRDWNSGFNSGSGSTLFHTDFTIPKSKTLSKNYVHSSLVLDQKLSDKGILRLYCLSHACHSTMSVFGCLSDLSVQIVRRSTPNRLEVHLRVQGPTTLVEIQKFRNVTHEFYHTLW